MRSLVTSGFDVDPHRYRVILEEAGFKVLSDACISANPVTMSQLISNESGALAWFLAGSFAKIKLISRFKLR